MRRRVLVSAVMLSVAAVVQAAHAHHSHPYFYDECRSVTVEGLVDQIEFKDPHTLIHLRLDDGADYVVEWAALRGLTNTGVIGPARASLVAGARVGVTGNRIRTTAEIREHFSDFTGEVSPNLIDPVSIRLGVTAADEPDELRRQVVRARRRPASGPASFDPAFRSDVVENRALRMVGRDPRRSVSGTVVTLRARFTA